MYRLVLAGIGAFIGYRLAKTGRSHANMVIATLAALIVYKLTQARMLSEGQPVAQESAPNPVPSPKPVEQAYAQAKPINVEVVEER